MQPCPTWVLYYHCFHTPSGKTCKFRHNHLYIPINFQSVSWIKCSIQRNPKLFHLGIINALFLSVAVSPSGFFKMSHRYRGFPSRATKFHMELVWFSLTCWHLLLRYNTFSGFFELSLLSNISSVLRLGVYSPAFAFTYYLLFYHHFALPFFDYN